MDDAALSIGGLLIRAASEAPGDFCLVSMIKWSPFTYSDEQRRPMFADVGTVTAIRLAESVRVAASLGGKHIAMQGLDAPLKPFVGCDGNVDWTGVHNQASGATSS